MKRSTLDYYSPNRLLPDSNLKHLFCVINKQKSGLQCVIGGTSSSEASLAEAEDMYAYILSHRSPCIIERGGRNFSTTTLVWSNLYVKWRLNCPGCLAVCLDIICYKWIT